MPNRNAEVARQLDAFNTHFEEGQSGRLDLQVTPLPSQADMLWLVARTDGIACHLKTWSVDGDTLSIQFKKGPLAMGMIPLSLGDSGVNVLSWSLFEAIGLDKWFTAMKGIAIPLGVIALGAGVIYVGRSNTKVILTGAGIIGVGGYLAYRELQLSHPTQSKINIASQGLPNLAVDSQ